MIFLITGKPGSGKSTLIQELIKELQNKKKIAGIITPEIRKQGIRQGFKIIDLASRKEKIMASLDFKPARLGKYGVRVENIEEILKEFEKSWRNSEIIFLDEIGPMEFFSQKFKNKQGKITPAFFF